MRIVLIAVAGLTLAGCVGHYGGYDNYAAYRAATMASYAPRGNAHIDYKATSFSTVNQHVSFPGQYLSPNVAY